ncbi:MAG: hypothetical protein KDH93_12610, partial [Rhodoferax sp.]|nr:hypothetical protein [Rhodoferax sp.]
MRHSRARRRNACSQAIVSVPRTTVRSGRRRTTHAPRRCGDNAGSPQSRPTNSRTVRRLHSPAVRTETAALWQLAWPILIGQLATMGMGVVDVAMAGHASAQDLAGVSLGVSIWHLVIITLMGILMAVSPIVSQHVGARAFHEIPGVVRQALWKALGLGLTAMVVANVAGQLFN